MRLPSFWSWQSGALLGLTLTAAVAALFASDRRQPFLPGRTSDGHHQIETKCAACHTPFGGVQDRACLDCHAAELSAVKDSHGLDKFRDPRTADMLSAIDATRCVTCHREHLPQITSAMSVSVPADFCEHCHADIETERPSHRGFSPDGCASTGCHRYHDNTALYEDFLLSRLQDVDTKAGARRPVRGLAGFAATHGPARQKNLTRRQHDGKAGTASAAVLAEWEASAHARGGVNCSDCHRAANKTWTDRPSWKSCERCHAPETQGFLAGRHGMRLDQDLPPMSPGEARLPMRAKAGTRELGCGSCHSAHSYDTRRAAVDACRSCHDDEHSRSYAGSPHHRLWQREVSGELPAGAGVSCATCHLPTATLRDRGHERMAVQHNQNANLRPDDKFLRSVCLDCHGAFFALNALADAQSVRRNFRGPPRARLETFEMIRRRAAP